MIPIRPLPIQAGLSFLPALTADDHGGRLDEVVLSARDKPRDYYESHESHHDDRGIICSVRAGSIRSSATWGNVRLTHGSHCCGQAIGEEEEDALEEHVEEGQGVDDPPCGAELEGAGAGVVTAVQEE